MSFIDNGQTNGAVPDPMNGWLRSSMPDMPSGPTMRPSAPDMPSAPARPSAPDMSGAGAGVLPTPSGGGAAPTMRTSAPDTTPTQTPGFTQPDRSRESPSMATGFDDGGGVPDPDQEDTGSMPGTDAASVIDQVFGKLRQDYGLSGGDNDVTGAVTGQQPSSWMGMMSPPSRPPTPAPDMTGGTDAPATIPARPSPSLQRAPQAPAPAAPQSQSKSYPSGAPVYRPRPGVTTIYGGEWGSDSTRPRIYKEGPDDQPGLAAGGAIPDGQPQQPQMPRVMGYLQGAGAAHPRQAMAMRREVDPHGQMTPGQRNATAIAHAATKYGPQAGAAQLQHDRQKYNAYKGAATVALDRAKGMGNDRPQ